MDDEPKTRKTGRPPTWTPETAPPVMREICERLASGESLLQICRSPGLPADSTVRKWVIDDWLGFSTQYTRARETGLDVLAEQCLAIADQPAPGEVVEEGPDGLRRVTRSDQLGHRRLQFDARRWYLSKLAPKRFGDRVATELSGPDGGPIALDDGARAARVAALLATAQARAADAAPGGAGGELGAGAHGAGARGAGARGAGAPGGAGEEPGAGEHGAGARGGAGEEPGAGEHGAGAHGAGEHGAGAPGAGAPGGGAHGGGAHGGEEHGAEPDGAEPDDGRDLI